MEQIEQWRAVAGFERSFEVSCRGRVRSYRGRSAVSVPRPLKAMQKPEGYAYVDLYLARRRSRYVHALVAEAFLGPRPAGHEVNHRNGDKADNALENVEYVSRSENMRHAYRHGLREPVGHPSASNPNAVLTEPIVRSLKLALREGVPVSVVARSFGIPSQVVSNIRSGRRWASVR